MRKAYRIISIEAADIYRQEQENGGSVGYKMPERKSDAKVFSGHFIQKLLDNPVYCGKIAYGRRKHERVKGKKNEYRVVCQKEFSLTDGLHEGIVSEELWEKARDKRVATALKLVHFSKIYDIINDEDRKELLAELIKEIHIYPEGENEYPLKSIKFAFPIVLDGKEINEIFLNKPPSVETLVCLSHKKADTKIEVALDLDANDIRDEIVDIENRVKSR